MRRLFGLLLAATSLHAAPAHYTITFTGGSVTPSGYFDYDPAAQVFVDFIVLAGGATFDLTAASGDLRHVSWLILAKAPSQSVFNIEASGNGQMAIDDYVVQPTVTSGQLPAGASHFLNSVGAGHAASGGTGSVSMLTSHPTNCPWTAIGNASWLTIVSGAPRYGSCNGKLFGSP